MIPGDIDLTENLDFRKVVRKNIPQLPKSWGGNKVKNSLNYTITSDTYYTTSYTQPSYYTINTSDNYNITYEWNNDISLVYDEISELTVSNFSINSNNTTYITSSLTNSSTKINIINKEPEYDIFGNIKKPPEIIPAIPWKTGSKHVQDKRIPWKYNHFHNRVIYTTKDDTRIPWENNDTHKWAILNMDNIAIRARYAIAWLRNKTISFVERHLNIEDGDDMRYLNNMAWIRVRDAIID